MGLRCFKRKPALCQVGREKRFHAHCQFRSHYLEHCVDKNGKVFSWISKRVVVRGGFGNQERQQEFWPLRSYSFNCLLSQFSELSWSKPLPPSSHPWGSFGTSQSWLLNRLTPQAQGKRRATGEPREGWFKKKNTAPGVAFAPLTSWEVWGFLGS